MNALPRPSRWHLVAAAKHIGPATVGTNVKLDEMTITATGIKVHVRMQGSAAYSTNGNYFAMYRIWVEQHRPKLNAAVSTNNTFAITATDGDGKTVVRDSAAATCRILINRACSFPGGAVAVTSRNAGLFTDAFVVGNGSPRAHGRDSGGAWAGWWTPSSVTGVPGSPITAISRSKDHLDVFVADGTGKIMTASWEPSFTGWHGWSEINNGVTAPGGAVTAVSRPDGFPLPLHRGNRRSRLHRGWSPGATGWGGWWPIPGITVVPAGARSLCYPRHGQDQLFVADAQGRRDGGGEPTARTDGGSQVLGGMTAPGAQVAAVSRRTDYLDVFHIGNDGKVYTGGWAPTPGTWGGWSAIPGIVCRGDADHRALATAGRTRCRHVEPGGEHHVGDVVAINVGVVGMVEHQLSC